MQGMKWELKGRQAVTRTHGGVQQRGRREGRGSYTEQGAGSGRERGEGGDRRACVLALQAAKAHWVRCAPKSSGTQFFSFSFLPFLYKRAHPISFPQYLIFRHRSLPLCTFFYSVFLKGFEKDLLKELHPSQALRVSSITPWALLFHTTTLPVLSIIPK